MDDSIAGNTYNLDPFTHRPGEGPREEQWQLGNLPLVNVTEIDEILQRPLDEAKKEAEDSTARIRTFEDSQESYLDTKEDDAKQRKIKDSIDVVGIAPRWFGIG